MAPCGGVSWREGLFVLIRGGFVRGAWWRRAEVWRQPQERLRSLLSQAVENLAAAVEEGDLKASIEVLTAVGMYGDGAMNAIHGHDPERLIHEEAERRVRAEGISEDPTHDMLIDMTTNPAYQRRLAEVMEELYQEYGEGGKTGGIYKRRTTGERVQFPRNGTGFQVPQLTDGPGEYALYRVELDNFREDVLVELLIDASERVIDGAEYYYMAAKMLWRETIRRGAVEVARTLIQRAVRQKTQPVERSLRELRDRLDARWADLTAAEQTLIERVREDYDAQYESIQEDIDDLQRQIDELRERQEALGRQQWDIRETADDVVAFLRAVKRAVVPDIPAAQALLVPADEQLRTYREAQEGAQTEPVATQFTVEPAAIQGVVNCSSHAGTVFARARAGAETFTAELDYQESRRVTSAARDDLEAQQASMTVDVPDLPAETVDDIAQRVRDADALLAQAGRTGELSAEWQTLRTHLVDHYLNDDLDWDPWDEWDDGGWRP
jgi:hypothetical protein